MIVQASKLCPNCPLRGLKAIKPNTLPVAVAELAAVWDCSRACETCKPQETTRNGRIKQFFTLIGVCKTF